MKFCVASIKHGEKETLCGKQLTKGRKYCYEHRCKPCDIKGCRNSAEGRPFCRKHGREQKEKEEKTIETIETAHTCTKKNFFRNPPRNARQMKPNVS